MGVKVKICGVTQSAQAREITELGADYIGCVIEFPKSLRSVNAERAREIRLEISTYRNIALVGVVVDLPLDRLAAFIDVTGIRTWQLHGTESPEYVRSIKNIGVEVWKAVTRENYMYYADITDKLLVDALDPVHGAGGSGRLSDWDFAQQLVQMGYEVTLSGGLNPENVQAGINFVKPAAVDVSSGVEESPGIKDISKVERFIRNIRSMPA